MAVYLPHDWPAEVFPPGSEDFEASAVSFPGKFICSARSGVEEYTTLNSVADRRGPHLMDRMAAAPTLVPAPVMPPTSRALRSRTSLVSVSVQRIVLSVVSADRQTLNSKTSKCGAAAPAYRG